MDVHFNSYKCKYEMLNGWIQPFTRSKKVKSIKFFINLDDFFHGLFKPNVNNEFEVCGKNSGKQFLSNTLNLLAHYRYWAIKQRYEVEVYGYYSTGKNYKNSIFVSDYRDKAKKYLSTDKYFYVKDAIVSSLDMASLITSYIPKVYMIDTQYLEPSILPLYITEKYGESDLNIVISRDVYDLQYAHRDGWMFVSPRGDNSLFIHRGNMWDYINYKEKIYSDKTELHYPPKMLTLARAIVGDTYRGIPRLRSIGWKTLFKYLDTVKNEITENNYILLEMELKSLLKGKLITDSVLQRNINCVDIEMQVNVMSEIDKVIIDNQIKDIEDFENLKMINHVKLSRFPLNLKFLCDTVQAPANTKVNQWFSR